MKVSELMAVLESVLEEKGDVEMAILDNDTDALIEVSRIGMASDGRLALYGHWSSAVPYGRIMELVWWGPVNPGSATTWFAMTPDSAPQPLVVKVSHFRDGRLVVEQLTDEEE